MSSDREIHRSERHRDLAYRRYATALVAGAMLIAGVLGGLASGLHLGLLAMYQACLCLALIGTTMMTSAWGGAVETVAQVDQRGDELGEQIAEIRHLIVELVAQSDQRGDEMNDLSEAAAEMKGEINEMTEVLHRAVVAGSRDADRLARRRIGADTSLRHALSTQDA